MNIAVEEHPRRTHVDCDQQPCCENVTPISSKMPPLDPTWRKLELYTQMFHACFLPATTETLHLRTGELRNRRLSMAECVRRRALFRIPAIDLYNAIKGRRTEQNLDYLLEYGLRLYSGVDHNIPMDHCFALRLFSEIVNFCSRGCQHEDDKQSTIAANCYIYIVMLQQRHTEDEFPGMICSCEALPQAFIYLAESCQQRMFTYSALWFWLWLSGTNIKLFPVPDVMMEMYQDEWDIFRQESGVQPFGTNCCAYCEKEGVRRSNKLEQADDGVPTLKLCAGGCVRDKKPSYCSPWCQAMDWECHRRWCKGPDSRPRRFVEEKFFL